MKATHLTVPQRVNDPVIEKVALVGTTENDNGIFLNIETLEKIICPITNEFVIRYSDMEDKEFYEQAINKSRLREFLRFLKAMPYMKSLKEAWNDDPAVSCNATPLKTTHA